MRDGCKRRGLNRCVAFLAVSIVVGAAAGGEAQTGPPALQIARLDECRTEGGEPIRDCSIGYRTVGTLDRQRRNAVLILPALIGRSQESVGQAGATAPVDTSKFFAVVVDPLANGVSSSPSTSSRQPGARFPRISIRDMVRAQYRLLTEHLKLEHLHAIVGGSMGGMQALEWSTSYPGFADRIVVISGSPKLPPWDRTVFTTVSQVISEGRRTGQSRDTIIEMSSRLTYAASWSPQWLNNMGEAQFAKALGDYTRQLQKTLNLDDFAAQVAAIINHDITTPFGGSLEAAAKATRARFLFIYSLEDHLVTPGSATKFAALVAAQTLAMPSPCGHQFTSCEREAVTRAVRDFLNR